MIIILSCLQCEKRICNLEKQIWIALNALYNHYFQSDLIGSAVCKSLAAQVLFTVCSIIMLFRNSFSDISFNVIKSLKQLFKVKLQISDEQFPDKSFYTAFLYINSFSAYSVSGTCSSITVTWMRVQQLMWHIVWAWHKHWMAHVCVC